MKTSRVIILACGKNCQSRYPPKDSLSLIPGCVQPEWFRLYCTMELQVDILQELKLHLQYCSSKAPKVTYCTIVLSQSLWLHTLNIPQCNGMQYGVKTHPVSGHWYLLWIVNWQYSLKFISKWGMYVISEEWCQCCHCLVPDVVASVGQNLTTAKTFQVLRTTSAVWVLRRRCAQPTPLDRGQVLTLYSGMQYVKSLHHHEQIILQCLYTNTHINSTVFVLLLYWTLPSF